MPLTDTFVKQIKFSGQGSGDKHSDGGGLHLLVNAVGKYWRMAYRFDGKQKTLALGVYPAVSLASARRQRDQAKERLAAGEDPGPVKKAIRRAASRSAGITLQSVAEDWLKLTQAKRAANTNRRVRSWFERDIFPTLGGLPIDAIRPLDVLDALRVIEARGAVDSAHRVRGYLSQLFRYAKVLELAPSDLTEGLGEAMGKKESGHYAAITDPVKVGALLRAIDAYEGHPFCQAALRIAPLVFLRPGELRAAEWVEFDLDGAEWRIPAERMKMGIEHIVPLADQVATVLRGLQRISGAGRYVFPSIRSADKCMSDNTINAALRGMGYPKEVMTGHGFRAMARTIMDEVLGERVDLIEHQLAHAVKDANGRAYNRTTHLAARRAMMQRWADYLDTLKRGAVVVPLHSGR